MDALEYLQKHQVDLRFLDINISKLSGISFPKFLQKPPLIIFTTAYSEYALKSYELNAIDYLLKPIEFDRLLQAVMKVKQIRKKNNEDMITGANTPEDISDQTAIIKSSSEFHQLPIQKYKIHRK